MKDHHLTQHRNKETQEGYDKDNLAERLQLIKEKYRNKRSIHIPNMYVSSGSAFNFYAFVFDKPGVTAHISFD
jgi:hypothetical protein